MAQGPWRLVAVLTSAPWRRAPLLLWRRPGLLLALAGGCLVLASSVASVPLFLSSAGTGAVAVQAGERCPRDTGASYWQPFALDQDDAADPRLVPVEADLQPDRVAAWTDDLAPPELWMRLEVDLVGAGGSGATGVTVLTRDSALDHVEVIDGSVGPGLWISDRATEVTGLGRGDQAILDGGDGSTASVPIAGVYRDLTGNTQDDFWCSHADMLALRDSDRVPPPPVLLVDQAGFAEMTAQLGWPEIFGTWESALRTDDLTLADSARLGAGLTCETGSGHGAPPAWCTAADTEAFETGPPAQADMTTHLPFVVDRARAIRTSVAGGVVPVAAFAALAGVGLVGAAASLWFDRRRAEVTLLTVRGAPPVALGLKAVLELLPALVLGTAAGLGLAYGLVVWLGPSSLVEPTAVTRAVTASLVALVVAAAAITSVVGVRARFGHRRRSSRWLGHVPWEVALAVAALVSYRRLGEWGVPTNTGAGVSRVDVFGLLFPLLFLVAVVALVARLVTLALRPLLVVSRRWPTELFLAVRRVSRYRVAVVGLVAATAVASGVLVYGATLTRSLNATLEAKATTFTGSDLAVRLMSDEQAPSDVAEASTTVQVYRGASIELRDGPQPAVVLAVDPDTFEDTVRWDPAFADASLDEVLRRLAQPPVDGNVPAVVVGTDAPDVTELGRHTYTGDRFMIDQVAAVSAFPGMKAQTPTVVISQASARDLDLREALTEVWIRGDRADARAAFAAAGVSYREARNVDEVVDRAAFQSVSWTFGYMQALSVAAGVLVVGGMAVYLDARRRGRVLGYAFARRMGLSRRSHRRVLFVELTASVVVGCWLGLVTALVGAGLAVGRIDPVPGLQPDPLLRPAVVAAVLLGLAAVLVAVLGAIVAQWHTDRDDPVEVLRAGV